MTFYEVIIDELSKLATGDEDENKGTKPSEKAVLEFIKRKPRPSDDDMHDWAESKKHNVHKAEATAYGILSDLMNKGRSKGKAPAGIKDKDVKEGVSIETEHTPNKIIQRKITDDHNAELPKYYDKKKGLPAMEKELDKTALFTGAFVDELEKIAKLPSHLRNRIWNEPDGQLASMTRSNDPKYVRDKVNKTFLGKSTAGDLASAKKVPIVGNLLSRVGKVAWKKIGKPRMMKKLKIGR